MTYFLDKTLVQTRSASDNSTVVKRQLKLEPDGSMKVEQITTCLRTKWTYLSSLKRARQPFHENGFSSDTVGIAAMSRDNAWHADFVFTPVTLQ